MRKSIIVILLLVLASVNSFAGNRWRIRGIGGTVYGVMDTDGNFTVLGDMQAEGGILNVHETFLTVEAESATKHFDVDIGTAALLAGATVISVEAGSRITQAEHPRNVVADIDFYGFESTATYVGSMVITGTDALGESATETLVLSTNSVTGAVAWSNISSVMVTATSIVVGTNPVVNIELGQGNLLGLSNDITATDDIYKVSENSAGVLLSNTTISYTYDTYFPLTVPSDTNYEIWYKAKGSD